MFPQFPYFQKITHKDRSDYNQLIPPKYFYSDFSFIGMWIWNIKETLAISLLDDNLIYQFTDYMEEDPFLSILGNHQIIPTIQKVIDYSQDKFSNSTLKLIPKDTLRLHQKDIRSTFKLINDRDNADYLYSTQLISELAGKNYHKKRNLAKRFIKENPDHQIVILNTNEFSVHQKITNLFNLWVEQKKEFDIEEANLELQVIKRYLDYAKYFSNDTLTLGIQINNDLIGFSATGLSKNGCANAYFRKANIEYSGIYEYLEQITCQYLVMANQTYLNYEQDLGIPNLRKSKSLWKPIKIIPKYQIKPK